METFVQAAQGQLRGLVENELHIFKGVRYAVFMQLTVGEQALWFQRIG